MDIMDRLIFRAKSLVCWHAPIVSAAVEVTQPHVEALNLDFNLEN